MPQTSQMIAEYPEILLHVIAELRGASLDGEKNVRAMIDSLGGQITDPTSVLMAFQEITDTYPQARSALDLLLAEGGEAREAQFSREYGSIRQMGPARLEREQPWERAGERCRTALLLRTDRPYLQGGRSERPHHRLHSQRYPPLAAAADNGRWRAGAGRAACASSAIFADVAPGGRFS